MTGPSFAYCEHGCLPGQRCKVVPCPALAAIREAKAVPRRVAGAAAMVAEFNEHPNGIGRDATREILPTLHDEEHEELQEALEIGDPAKIARELADVVYLAYTEAWARRIDLDVAVAEIHAAAMRKIEANVRRADGKLLKPPGFEPPCMAAAIIDTREG